MPDKEITVLSYEGYRDSETPRAFLLDGERIEVMKVLDRRVEEDGATGRRMRCFRVKGSDWKEHTLCLDEDKGTWSHSRRERRIKG